MPPGGSSRVTLGVLVGSRVGVLVGSLVGKAVGLLVGSDDGLLDAFEVGSLVGRDLVVVLVSKGGDLH